MDAPNGTVSAVLRYYDQTSPATGRVRRYDRAARMGRALRMLGACWGLAVAAVFIPVLHFILVPALLIGGPLLALQRWGEDAVLLGASGACPACGHAQDFALHAAKLGPPVAHRCESCGRALTLEAESPRAAPPTGR